MWEQSAPLTSEWINNYEFIFDEQALKNAIRNSPENVLLDKSSNNTQIITPNIMQEEALNCLQALRNKNKHKALIISATGTGKTILCALDVKNYNPNKFLFIVHNEGILNKAIEEFKKFYLIVTKMILAYLLEKVKTPMLNIYLLPFRLCLTKIFIMNLIKRILTT